MKFIVGSTYFFKQYSDFISKDIDYLNYVEKIIFPIPLSKTEDNFYIEKSTKNIIIEDTIRWSDNYRAIGHFLNKEFNEEIGFTVDDLKNPMLKRMADRCHGKHNYVKMIYYFYLQNNSFTLTEEQRLEAYKNYKAARPEIYKK